MIISIAIELFGDMLKENTLTKKSYVWLSISFILVFLGVWALLGLWIQLKGEGLLFIGVPPFWLVPLLLAFLSGLRFGKRSIILATVLPIVPVTVAVVLFGMSVATDRVGVGQLVLGLLILLSVGFIGVIANLAFVGSLFKDQGLTVFNLFVFLAITSIDAFILSPFFDFATPKYWYTNHYVLRGFATVPLILMIPVILIYATGLIGKLFKKRQLSA